MTYNAFSHRKLEKNIFGVDIDCKNAQTLTELNRLLSTGFHFPQYFSGNLNSMEECLNDLSWISDALDYKLGLINYDCLLVKEKPEIRTGFLQLLRDIELNYWRKAGDENKQEFYIVIDHAEKARPHLQELGINFLET